MSLVGTRSSSTLHESPINQRRENHKQFRLILSNDLSWHKHLDYKTKSWSRINAMCKLKFQLDRNSLQVIFMSFIRPLPEYFDVVSENCAHYEINELEKIQNEAARIVTGASTLVSIETVLRETGWENISKKEDTYKLLLFYKLKNDSCAECLSSPNNQTYNLHHSTN